MLQYEGYALKCMDMPIKDVEVLNDQNPF